MAYRNRMKDKSGTGYSQNYDLVVKWLSDALRGETLDVIGVKTGRIREVFGFEPSDIAVRAGRVDVMARDDTGAVYHIEEQRDLSETDMYRFAAYHFLAAERWGQNLTDIILASGEVYAGDKAIATKSGTYSPIVIDFSKRDGRKRLAEIREAVNSGYSGDVNPLELVFLPLCGKETGIARSEMAEQVLRFESELYHAGKISSRLVAATLILSNKFIDRDRLRALWEEIKMLDILEIAREEGIKEGKFLGVQEGKLLSAREMLTDALIERFGAVPIRILERIRTVQDVEALKVLHRQVLKCQNIGEFETVMQQVL